MPEPTRNAPILVTGGAGYIGSHTARQLVDAGHRVVVVDNLYSGHRWAVPGEALFVEADAGDGDAMAGIISTHRPAAVIHFAGHIVVPESVSDPLKYYENNTGASQRLVSACLAAGLGRFIFSSSAAVYGQPDCNPIPESSPARPISPYGTTKLITEWMLRDVADSMPGGEFRYVALRYFNVAGARLDGTLGQATPQATHLIKVAAEAACGVRDGITVFGCDYDTPDGTCVRDYIHVDDLARAHLAALDHLLDGGDSSVFNCGYGHGYSVRQIVDTVRAVSGAEFSVTEGPRRPGDPAQLMADSSAIRATLGWEPRHDDIDLICRSACQWERRLHSGDPAVDAGD